jgi:hypothetical protein
MDRTPKPGEKYRHFKNKLYQIVAIAQHSETKEPLVIYQALYGDFGVYARPLEMFVSEVDHVKYPYVSQKYRFELVEPERAAVDVVTGTETAEKVPGNVVPGTAEKVPGTDVPEAENAEKVPGTAGRVPEAVAQPQLEDAGAKPQDMADVNPKFMAFLETDSFDERYNILVSMQDEITDQMIDSMAVVMDVSISEGPLLKRYDDLKNAIRTRQRYEFANRLK